MAFIITTTGTLSPVIFDDIGWEVSHPTVSLDIQQPNGSFKLEDIQSSVSLQNAIDSGYITVVDENAVSITSVSLYDNSHNKVTLLGTPDYITISGQSITRNKLDISDDTNLISGTGISVIGNTVSVGGLGVTQFTSPNISQWTNDSGYGTVTSVGASGGSTGLVFSGSPITSSGTLILSGVLGATAGGTGQTTYVVGDILFANTTSTLSKLAGVATGNVLISGGVGASPSWGKVGLSTHITGTLPLANGGTGQTTKAAAFNALSPNTTKGDITVFTTTNVRLPIGATAGQVLIVDSTQAAGMRWASSSEIAGQTLRFLSANSDNSQTVSNTTTEIDFTTNGTNYMVPSNTIKQYTVLRFLVYGRFNTKSGAVGSLTIRLKIGSLVINTNVCELGSATTNLGFQFTGQIQCRTSGAGGTVYSHLLCVFNGNSSTPTTFASSSNGTNTFNTTIGNTIQMSAQWSNANTDNAITVEQATFEILN